MRFFPGGLAPTSSITNGPSARGNKFHFTSNQWIAGMYCYNGATAGSGGWNGGTVTCKILDSTGTTILASGTITATSVVGEYFVQLDFQALANITYIAVMDDNAAGTGTFREYRTQNAVTTAQTSGPLVLEAGGGFGGNFGSEPNSEWAVDIEFFPVRKTVLQGASIARNGTLTHTCTFKQPTAGALLVAVIAGGVTSTTPAGWNQDRSQVANSGLYLFSKISDGTETSFTTTHNAANYPILGEVFEFPAGTTEIAITGANGTANTNTALPSLTGLTGTYLALAVNNQDNSSTTVTATVAWTTPALEDVDFSIVKATTDGDTFSIAYAEAQTAASFTASRVVTNGGGNNNEMILAAFALPSGGGGGGSSYTPAQSDSEGITDAVSVARDYNRTVADAIGLTDTGGVQQVGYNPTIPDAVGVTDTASTVKSVTTGPSDAAGITDTVTVAQDFTRSAGPDLVGLSDNVSVQRDYNPVIADGIGVTDSAASSLSASGNVAQDNPVGLSDSVTVNQDFNRLTSESVGLTDAVAVTRGFNPVISDSAGISDAVSFSKDLTRSSADPVGLTDAVSVSRGYSVTISDGIGLVDTGAVAVGYSRVVSDAIGVSDNNTHSSGTAGPDTKPAIQFWDGAAFRPGIYKEWNGLSWDTI